MKKTEASTKAGSKAVKAAMDLEQQTEDERYEALLSRIRASLAMCQMMTDELGAAYNNDSYKIVTIFRELYFAEFCLIPHGILLSTRGVFLGLPTGRL